LGAVEHHHLVVAPVDPVEEDNAVLEEHIHLVFFVSVLILGPLFLGDEEVDDFSQVSVVHLVDLDRLARGLFGYQLVLVVHEAVDEDLVGLEDDCTDHAIW